MRTLALTLALALAFVPAPSRAQDDPEQDAIADLMQGLANGFVKKADSKVADDVIGWTLTSLGLGSSGSADAAVLDALAAIEQTLIEISTELEDVVKLLEEEACQNAANVVAVRNALDRIDAWAGRGPSPAPDSYLDLVKQAQEGIDVRGRMVSLFNTVLSDDILVQLLTGLDNALRDQASAEGVLSACGLLVDLPTNQWDDRAYFQSLTDLAGYYAEYQARAVLLLSEAYHYQALQAWLDAGHSVDSIPQEDVPSICVDATGEVLEWCSEAEDAFNWVKGNIRAQYGQVGASYSSGPPGDPTAEFVYDPDEPVVQVHIPTGFVWVKNIDDFFAKGGYATSCQASTSSQPCGPGVGTYDHLTFEAYGTGEPLRYGANGGYTTWRPAPVSEWTLLAEGWSGNSTTLASQLEKHDLVGISTPRVYFTGDTDTTGHHAGQDSENGAWKWHFDAVEVACFIATPMNKGDSVQPFCSGGFDNLMHGARDHTNSHNPCYTANSTDHKTLDDAGIDTPFFDFLYTMQDYECASAGHGQGQTFYPAPPGWLVQYRSWRSSGADPDEDVSEDTGVKPVQPDQLQAQYHWPVFDANQVACNTEPATLQPRSPYALNGRTQLVRMCGDDFDAWFDKWIAPPANLQSAPTVQTPDPIVQELPPGDTDALAHHEITLPVDYAAQVGAVDVEDGVLPVSCFPASGTAFQLGTTEVRCSATDGDGATTQAVFPLSVRFPFRFVGRIDDHGLARAHAGATLKVAFSLGGDRGLDAVAPDGLTTQAVDCQTGEPLADPEPARGRTGLRWQRKPGLYRFAWATDRSWQGSCRALRIALVDGSVHAARVEFAPKPGARCDSEKPKPPKGKAKSAKGKGHAKEKAAKGNGKGHEKATAAKGKGKANEKEKEKAKATKHGRSGRA